MTRQKQTPERQTEPRIQSARAGLRAIRMPPLGKLLFLMVRAMPRSRKTALLLAMDVLLVPAALLLALLVTGPSTGPAETAGKAWGLFPVMTLAAGGVIWLLRLPKVKLIAYEAQAIVKTAVAAVSLAAIGLFAAYLDALFGPFHLPLAAPPSAFFVFAFLFFGLSVAARLVGLRVVQWIYDQGGARTRVLIYGAGGTGVQLAAALSRSDNIDPVAFVDDNPSLQGMTVAGRRVHPPAELPLLLSDLGVDRVVLAIPSAPQTRQLQIARRLEKLGCRVQRVPSFAELIGKRDIARRLEPVLPAEFLGRERFSADRSGLVESYAGKTVLVTGAGGSIGSELCRQLLPGRPAALILLDHSEAALYTVEKELKTLTAEAVERGAEPVAIHAVLGSVTDRALVRDVFDSHAVHAVLHAAAYKHVPLVEENPIEGLRNNVLGTHVMASAAVEARVERFILVSTDKAVRPTNVMGASKRMAELVVQDLARRSAGTLFSIVRFGNVLGSSGSVLPLFQEQIARGGPVTLTDPDVTRYFMTVTEAAQLVLLAGSFTRGNDLFILDMGKPVPIRKLARQMIERAGYTVRDRDNPDGDIPIVITGLRPGEKLHEELLMNRDARPTRHPKILRAREPGLSELETAAMLRDLRRAIEDRDGNAAAAVVRQWVEGFHEPPVRALKGAGRPGRKGSGRHQSAPAKASGPKGMTGSGKELT